MRNTHRSIFLILLFYFSSGFPAKGRYVVEEERNAVTGLKATGVYNENRRAKLGGLQESRHRIIQKGRTVDRGAKTEAAGSGKERGLIRLPVSIGTTIPNFHHRFQMGIVI